MIFYPYFYKMLKNRKLEDGLFNCLTLISGRYTAPHDPFSLIASITNGHNADRPGGPARRNLHLWGV